MENTYGVIIRRVDGTILLCHPTGHKPKEMSIPKGLNDPGESPKQAAVREVFEETGLSLDPCRLIPLNSQKYPGRNKTLHPFVYDIKEEEIVNHIFKCSSYFTLHGRDIPEVNGWVWSEQVNSDYILHPSQKNAIEEMNKMNIK